MLYYVCILDRCQTGDKLMSGKCQGNVRQSVWRGIVFFCTFAADSKPKWQKYMEKKTKRQKSTRAEGQPWCCAFAWQNFMLTGVAVAFVVAGFLLMLPEVDVRNTVGGRYAPAPGPGAFEARRIRAAPIPCFIGFALMVPAILWVPRGRKEDENIVYPKRGI